MTILLMALAGAAAAQETAAQETPDPAVGTWRVLTSFRGRNRPATLVLRRDKSGELQGVWKDISQDSPVSHVKFEKGVLTLERAMGRSTILFKATIADGKLTGTQTVEGRGTDMKTTGHLLKGDDFDRNSMRAAPRDAFKVLDNPKMTAASRTKIKDSAWIIGVAIEGEAKAYTVRVMGSHELVNDTCGGEPIAASW